MTRYLARSSGTSRTMADNNAVHAEDGIAPLQMENQLAVPADGNRYPKESAATHDMQDNPYSPPQAHAPTRSRIYLGFSLKDLIAPAIAFALTLVLWVSSISLIDRPSDDTRAMLIWAFSLLVSLIVSVAFVARLSRLTVRPAPFAMVFAAFAIAFCLLEGDTSNGTDKIQATIVYGTMLGVPLVAGFTSWLVAPRENATGTQIFG